MATKDPRGYQSRSPRGNMRQILRIYVRKCKRNNVYWGLSDEEFYALIVKNCTYCGRRPSNQYSNFFYSGVDRMDNNQGYTPENCTSACKECNAIKSDHLSYSEMMAIAQALQEHRKSGKKEPKG